MKLEQFDFLVTALQSVRLKDSEDEHDDEEKDVWSQDGHLINAALSFASNTNSLCGKEFDKRESMKLLHDIGLNLFQKHVCALWRHRLRHQLRC